MLILTVLLIFGFDASFFGMHYGLVGSISVDWHQARGFKSPRGLIGFFDENKAINIIIFVCLYIFILTNSSLLIVGTIFLKLSPCIFSQMCKLRQLSETAVISPSQFYGSLLVCWQIIDARMAVFQGIVTPLSSFICNLFCNYAIVILWIPGHCLAKGFETLNMLYQMRDPVANSARKIRNECIPYPCFFFSSFI